jgi:hypothetical protein
VGWYFTPDGAANRPRFSQTSMGGRKASVFGGKANWQGTGRDLCKNANCFKAELADSSKAKGWVLLALNADVIDAQIRERSERRSGLTGHQERGEAERLC